MSIRSEGKNVNKLNKYTLLDLPVTLSWSFLLILFWLMTYKRSLSSLSSLLCLPSVFINLFLLFNLCLNNNVTTILRNFPLLSERLYCWWRSDWCFKCSSSVCWQVATTNITEFVVVSELRRDSIKCTSRSPQTCCVTVCCVKQGGSLWKSMFVTRTALHSWTFLALRL